MNNEQTFQSSNDTKLFTISVLSNQNSFEHAHKDIEIIYVIKGQLRVKISNVQHNLSQSDIILINSNEFHSFHSMDENLFVVIHLNYSDLSSLLSKKSLVFHRDLSNHDSFSKELKFNIDELLQVYIKKKNHYVELELLEKAYKISTILTSRFLKNVETFEVDTHLITRGQSDRLNDILEYININFSEPLTLDEVASTHYITSPYLSKFFKKQTGKTFSQYLNEVRLAHAVNELTTSLKPLTRVALDNGFPNLSAFNRVFKEYYEKKPLDFRRDNKPEHVEVVPKVSKLEAKTVLVELKEYLETNPKLPIQVDMKKENESTVQNYSVKIGKLNAFMKYWNKLINVGYAKDLLSSDTQEQITHLQNELGFKYARFWGIFGDDMLIEDKSGDRVSYNFTNTNKVLDFLVKNNLKPFIELGPKPKIISKTIEQTFVVQTIDTKSIEDWEMISRAFLLQCVDRYGIEEVETWYFEIWRPNMNLEGIGEQSRTEFLSNINSNKLNEPTQFDEYYKVFSIFKEIANELVPNSKVGGCGLSMNLEGDKLDLLLRQWKKESIQPDFLSFYLYPIEMKTDKKHIPIKNLHSPNPKYVNQKLNQVRKSLKMAGMEDMEINVTEWNISISNRNFLNDSCYKATYLIKNVIDNIAQHNVNMIGYWLSLDLFSDYRDSKNFLYGGSGLITKNGIKKPSYHAFVLLKQLGEILIAKGENYIVTKKSGNRYQLLCFNYKHFDFSYYLHPEGSIGIKEQYDIFEDNKILDITLEIQGVENGKYRIKERRLNRNNGSVLDEWLKFGGVEDIKPDEIEYLKELCVPSMNVKHNKVVDNNLKLTGKLDPHEVRLYDIYLVFE